MAPTKINHLSYVVQDTVSVTGSLTVNPGLGKRNLTVMAQVHSALAADANIASVVTVKDNADGTFTIYAWKVTTPGASGNPTLIAATSAVSVQYLCIAG